MPADHSDPAFPGDTSEHCVPGMSLRDYYVGQALVGVLMRTTGNLEHDVELTFRIADALLVERAKR